MRNSDFWTRAAGVERGSECGSSPPRLGVFVIGGAGVPESHITIAEPPNGNFEIDGISWKRCHGERPGSSTGQ